MPATAAAATKGNCPEASFALHNTIHAIFGRHFVNYNYPLELFVSNTLMKKYFTKKMKSKEAPPRPLCDADCRVANGQYERRNVTILEGGE